MATAVCSLEIRVPEDEQNGADNEGKTHACRADRAVHTILFLQVEVSVVRRLRGDVGDATTIGSAQIT